METGYEITMLEGFGKIPSRGSSTRSKKRGSTMKLSSAARACKGKKKRAFQACIKQKMGGGRRRNRRRSRRSRR